MKLGKWAERIYKETDFARNLSTAAAGSAGLAMYLYRDDLAVAAFGAAIVFPIVKVVASAAHSHWKETRERDRTKAELGPVNTYLSASKMSTKWMKPMNITSSFSNRENIRR